MTWGLIDRLWHGGKYRYRTGPKDATEMTAENVEKDIAPVRSPALPHVRPLRIQPRRGVIITSTIDDKKTTAWGESEFPATFPARCGLCPRESLAWGRRTTSRWHTVEGLCRGNRSTADA